MGGGNKKKCLKQREMLKNCKAHFALSVGGITQRLIPTISITTPTAPTAGQEWTVTNETRKYRMPYLYYRCRHHDNAHGADCEDGAEIGHPGLVKICNTFEMNGR